MEEDYIIFEEMKKKDANSFKQGGHEEKLAHPRPIMGVYSSLYEELRQKCNPSNFMHPYNFELVKLSNALYSEMEVNKSDMDALKRIRRRAVAELGIKISTEKLYNLLSNRLDPSKYVGNRELVDMANYFYNQMLCNADNIEVLEQIESSRQYEVLSAEYVKRAIVKQSIEKQLKQSNDVFFEDTDEVLLYLGVITAAIFIITIIGVILASF